MLTEQTRSAPNWTSLSGTVLEGGYELGELLEADEAQAKFGIRVLGDRSMHAYVRIFRQSGPAADEQIAAWETAGELKHPNLNRPLASGRLQVDGDETIYVVTKRGDEVLSAVLGERALTPAEAGEVLLSATRGLEQLLQNSLIHGCVSPEHIVAVGDSIQLSTECARRIVDGPSFGVTAPKYLAPESSGFNVTPAADVWCLGATLVEILTQRSCTGDCRDEARKLPPPFHTIAERCLDPDPQARCTYESIPTLYRGERARAAAAGAASPSAVASPAAQPTRSEPARSEPAHSEFLRPQPAVGLSRAPQNRQSPQVRPGVTARTRDFGGPLRPQARPPSSAKTRLWIYGTAALLVVLLIVWASRLNSSKPALATTRNAGRQAAPPTPAPSGAFKTRTLPAEGTPAVVRTPAPAAPAPVTAKPDRTTIPDHANVKGPVWRVVLYTYSRESDATNRARTLNAKHPDLAAEVFSPNGQAGPFLVTAGGQMSREDAVRFRQKALRLGVPHDTYIQNYKQ